MQQYMYTCMVVERNILTDQNTHFFVPKILDFKPVINYKKANRKGNYNMSSQQLVKCCKV